jgi:hypothetical protein
VRLDHLLSKEHVPAGLFTAGFSGQVTLQRMSVGGAHGWNIDSGSRIEGLVLSTALWRLERCGVGLFGGVHVVGS